jgi:ABC-type sugar transport system permease subunit
MYEGFQDANDVTGMAIAFGVLAFIILAVLIFFVLKSSKSFYSNAPIHHS